MNEYIDVIVDIDGTVADCQHRIHWIQTKPRNWKAFFSTLLKDDPIEPTCSVIRTFLSFSKYRIIFCTARNEECREGTREWLVKHLGILTKDCPLYMRAENDHREDWIVKRELLHQKIIPDGYNPTLVFEDRKRVADMWREEGIVVFHVAEGNF